MVATAAAQAAGCADVHQLGRVLLQVHAMDAHVAQTAAEAQRLDRRLDRLTTFLPRPEPVEIAAEPVLKAREMSFAYAVQMINYLLVDSY